MFRTSILLVISLATGLGATPPKATTTLETLEQFMGMNLPSTSRFPAVLFRVMRPVLPTSESSGKECLEYLRQLEPREDAPSEWIIERAMDYCESSPSEVFGLLPWIEHMPRFHEAVYRAWATLDEGNEKKWVKDWLMGHTAYFREDLVQELQTRNPFEGQDPWDIFVRWLDLNRADPNRAQALLKTLPWANSREGEALATLLRLAQAQDQDLGDLPAIRKVACRTLEDSSVLSALRIQILWTLQDKPWPEAADWALELMKRLPLGNEPANPPLPLFAFQANTETWIPLLAGLMNSGQSPLRENAARVLLSLAEKEAASEGKQALVTALESLLPCIQDPQWLTAEERNRLLALFGIIEVPGAGPLATSLLDSSHPAYNPWNGTRILEKNPCPEGIPALWAEFHKWEKGSLRCFLLRPTVLALWACEGIPEPQVASWVDSALTWNATLLNSSGRYAIREPLEVFCGQTLLASFEAHPRLANILLRRAEQLAPDLPERAERLRLEVWTWMLPESEATLIQCLQKSSPSLSDLQGLALQAQGLKERFASDLYRFLDANDWRSGAASALLEDKNAMNRVLAQGSLEARVALLAFARQLKITIPRAQ